MYAKHETPVKSNEAVLNYLPALREKFPYSEFFWSVFSRIRMNKDQKNSEYGPFSRCVSLYREIWIGEKLYSNIYHILEIQIKLNIYC